VSGLAQQKSSVIKSIRNKVVEDFPAIANYIDEILPKKDPLKVAKCQDHIEIVVGTNGEHLFFRQRDGPYFPSLKLIHKYPFMLPQMQVDKGAIAFVLAGANIMCPGLTSKGARLQPKVQSGSIVTVIAEGKEHALAVGILKMSPDEILKINKGVGIENIHYLNDGLWRLKPIK
jgi:PUA domain protein